VRSAMVDCVVVESAVAAGIVCFFFLGVDPLGATYLTMYVKRPYTCPMSFVHSVLVSG
jgi:hypothetical protein